MTPQQNALLALLAPGEFVSGEELGKLLGVSRAAVWKQLQQLEALGLALESVKGRGYRIDGGLDLLQEQAVLAQLSATSRPCLSQLYVEQVIDSTSSFLTRQLAQGGCSVGAACFAEQQTSGRGRRGRTWVSPFGRNIYCSLVWEFQQGIAALEGLSLAVGVAVVAALERLGFEGIQLKWPNDILWQGRKLGGVLLEVSGEASGTCQVVLGVGLNVHMPQEVAGEIDQGWVDLAHLQQSHPSRSRIAGTLLDELILMLLQFQQHGFSPFKPVWESLNAHHHQEVIVSTPARQVSGQMLGITDSGGLRLSVEGEEQVFLGGEISLRGQP